MTRLHLPHLALLLPLTLGTTAACEEYDAPPQPEIVQPASGAWSDGRSVFLGSPEPERLRAFVEARLPEGARVAPKKAQRRR